MDSYNLCDEPWIRVKYIDGKVKEVGVRQILKDAEQIEDILPPIFRGDRIYLYEVLVIKLLTTIIMSAYYKEDTGFASKNLDYLEILKETGIYTDVISGYLNRFYDRFDLYSKEHPFLQNVALKKLAEKDKDLNRGYRTWNPFAPSENNTVFGKIRSVDTEKENILDQYEITSKELAYILLYLANMGNYPAATVSKEGSLARKANVFIIVKGRTFADTLLLNTLPLNKSTRPLEDDEKPDMPVWELETIQDIEKYPKENLSNNKLLCTFFPGISVLAFEVDEKGFVSGMRRVTKKDGSYGLCAENTNMLSESYFDSSSITIRDKNEYMPFSVGYDTVSGLCLDATGHTDHGCNCTLLNQLDEEKDRKIYLYYRELDQYNIGILNSGRLDGNNYNTWLVLRDEEKHETAIKYQNGYKDVRAKLYKAFVNVFDKDFKFKDMAFQKLSDWIENDFFGVFTEDLMKSEDAYSKALKRMAAVGISIFDEYSLQSHKFIDVAKVRRELERNLLKIKERAN